MLKRWFGGKSEISNSNNGKKSDQDFDYTKADQALQSRFKGSYRVGATTNRNVVIVKIDQNGIVEREDQKIEVPLSYQGSFNTGIESESVNVISSTDISSDISSDIENPSNSKPYFKGLKLKPNSSCTIINNKIQSCYCYLTGIPIEPLTLILNHPIPLTSESLTFKIQSEDVEDNFIGECDGLLDNNIIEFSKFRRLTKIENLSKIDTIELKDIKLPVKISYEI